LAALIGVVLLTLSTAASGVGGAGLIALAAGSAPAASGGAAAAKTTPAPAKAAATKGKRAATAPVPPAVAAKVAQAPTDVLVMFDASAGLAKIRTATAGGLSQGSRAAASAAAASAYAATKRAALARAGGQGLHVERDYSYLPVQLIRIDSPAALAALAAAPGVSALSLPRVLRTQSVPVDLSLIHQPQAAAAGASGAGASVAVIDTGVDYTRTGASAYFGNCAAGPGTGTCRIDRLDDVVHLGALDIDPGRHGTNVSGVVAETAPSAHLTVYQVFRPVGGGLGAYDADILAALNDVIQHGAQTNVRAVNMSLGYGEVLLYECADSAYTGAFLSLRALGIVPVVAAGNYAEFGGSFNEGLDYPACTPGAVRVGATYAAVSGAHFWDCTENGAVDKVACFSESSTLLSILAPGVDITAVGITDSGTSQATPHVAAAVADLFSLRPQATAQEVVQAITSTGKPVTDPRDNVTTNRLDIAQAAAALSHATSAEVTDAACAANAIAATDDGSSPAVALPAPLDFYGTTYSSIYVNNNGNVTFQAPQATYTPFTINAGTPPIIAPFFADVDTSGNGSGQVTYGTASFGSRPAFCVDWNNVGYFTAHTDKLNSFQLLLVDRTDVGPGDFDIVMNFNTLNWEAGDASGGISGITSSGGTAAGAGFSAGDGDPNHFFQFPGSLTSLALLDTSPSTALVNHSRGSLQPGRYIFPVRNGAAPYSGELIGTVADNHGSPQLGAPVQACPEAGGDCVTGLSGREGTYTIVGLTPGVYDLTAYPPPGASLRPGRTTVSVTSDGVTVGNLAMAAPTPPPAGTTITSIATTGAGVPVVYWSAPLTLQTTACTGGTASYSITLGGVAVRSGAMAEGPAGHYQVVVAPFYPGHGDATVSISVTCPTGPPLMRGFDIYIDPTGAVIDSDGNPLAGATVTLLRSDSSTGPFVPVLNGSASMSPSGRDNPETTGPDGMFHWDTLAGFYQVRASRPGCHAVGSSATSVTSAVFGVPASGLQLTLACGAAVPVGLRASTTNAVAGQHVTLTATAGTDVGPVGLEILIRDRSTGNAVVTACTTGTVCTASVVQTGQHSYVAEIVSLAQRATRASSAVVTVTWPNA
jgi:hypothetical protein